MVQRNFLMAFQKIINCFLILVYKHSFLIYHSQFSLVAQSCLTLCDPMDCSMLGFSVLHRLPELAQTHQGVIPVSGFGIKREILIYHEEIQVCFLFVFVFLKIIWVYNGVKTRCNWKCQLMCKLTGKFKKRYPYFLFVLNPGIPPSPIFSSTVALINQSWLWP